ERELVAWGLLRETVGVQPLADLAEDLGALGVEDEVDRPAAALLLAPGGGVVDHGAVELHRPEKVLGAAVLLTGDQRLVLGRVRRIALRGAVVGLQLGDAPLGRPVGV